MLLHFSISFLFATLCLSSYAAPTTNISECSLNISGQTYSGLNTDTGGCRYTIQYGQAERWNTASSVLDQSSRDIKTLPPSCPQSNDGVLAAYTGNQDEQCLYAVVYTPKDVRKGDKLPIFVWIHGGSYYSGSATAPGLDGSILATKGNMIVVVVQYRLGVLGLLPPSSSPSSGDPNLAIKDVILALKQVQSYAGCIGGDKGKVTIGGQSSGASLIRALLSAPDAKGLFRAAVLQSDPMTYGTASASTTSQLQRILYSQPRMASCGDISCLKQIPIDEILKAQTGLIASAAGQVEGVPIVTPIRPTHNTPTLPQEPTSQIFSNPASLTSPPRSIPLLITTTSNEAGSVVSSLFPYPIPSDNGTYAQILSVFVGPERAALLVNSPEYALRGHGGDEFRRTFERLVSDGVWRCAGRGLADRWAEAGGNVWVGEWSKGVGYKSNEGLGYCGEEGRVCHEDDIYPTFQSSLSPNTAIQQLQADVLLRWSSFIHNLDPNSPPFRNIKPTIVKPSTSSSFGNITPPTSKTSTTVLISSTSSFGNIRPPKTKTSSSVSTPIPSGFRNVVSPTLEVTVNIAIPLLPGGIGSDRGIPAVRNRSANRDTKGGWMSGHHDQSLEVRAIRWEKYTGESGEVYAIGGGAVGLCPRGFWGQRVQFDWQVYP